MAIAQSEIQFWAGSRQLVSGRLHDLFGQGVVGAATDYRLVEVRNVNASLTWSGPVAWLTLDPDGAAVALAVADGTARALSYSYSVDPTVLTYSTPTTSTSGLALPNLAAQTKCLLAIRRTLAGASSTYPESNALRVSGSSPI